MVLQHCQKCRPTPKKVVVSLSMFLFLFFLSSLLFAVIFPMIIFGRKDQIPPTELQFEETTLGFREAVSFDSCGNRLQGWLYGMHAGQNGLIVIVHGLGDGADSHLAEIEVFVDAGYAVLAYDGTGTRRSEGRGVYGLPQSRADLEAALKFIAANPRLSALPLFLYGHSAGAYAAAVVLPEHPEITGAVCLSAFDRPVEEMLVQARRYVSLLANIEAPFLFLQERLRFGSYTNASAADAVRASAVPVLIAAGDEDEVVPFSISLYSRSIGLGKANIRHILCHASHSDIWLSSSARDYREEVLDGSAAPDARRCCELDYDFIYQVLEFFSMAEYCCEDAA